MGEKITRREFSGRAAVAAASLTLGTVAASGQTKPADKNTPAKTPLDQLETELGSPLPEGVRAKADEALKALRAASESRRKHALPEGSEPCTVYRPTPAPRRGNLSRESDR